MDRLEQQLQQERREIARKKAIKQARLQKKAWIRQRIDDKLESLRLDKAIKGDV